MNKLNSVKDSAVKGTKVIYTGITGNSKDRFAFSQKEDITVFDILTVHQVYKNESQILLQCLELSEIHNSDLFVEATNFFKNSFHVGQIVVYGGKTKSDSQKKAIEDLGVKRGDQLVISRVVPNSNSVYLGFENIIDLHNGLMFIDRSLWFSPN